MSRCPARWRSFQQQEEFDQLGDIKLWATRTTDGTRSDLSFRPLGSVWDAVQSDSGNCLGRDCPWNKDCYYFKARRRVWTANLLIVNHALFVTDLALRESGFGLLPEYDVAIFDEAHTLEAVAAEHMGLKVSNIGVDFTLARLYNDRSGKGLLSFHKLQEAMDHVGAVRMAAEDFFDHVADWQLRQNSSSNGRVRRKIDWPNHVCEELNKLASAIDRGAEDIEKPEQRIELTAARDRCRTLSGQIATWMHQTAEDQVYWIELEEKTRRRIHLAAAPLDVARACASYCSIRCAPAS